MWSFKIVHETVLHTCHLHISLNMVRNAFALIFKNISKRKKCVYGLQNKNKKL